MRPSITRALDAVMVVAFVLIGRANHDEATSITGGLDTLWPFAVGLLVGWLVGQRNPHLLTAGFRIWVSTVAVGMALRAAAGQGTAASFIVVATIFLGLTLLGWRLALFLRRNSRRPDRRTRGGRHYSGGTTR